MELQQLTVLLVEDSPMFRVMLRDMLQQMGVKNVVEQPNGKAAMEYLAAGEPKPDLVCLDLTLPDVSGYDVCEHIRRTPAIAHVPVLMVSARNLPEDKAYAEEAGANGYLGKPFTPEELEKRVRQVLKAAMPRGSA
ncbi:response regulator [Corallococcus interemptor]|uniref:exopolysaccharide biosynthesis response regulator EpsW n=1 Tax=Corallococcus TaxID=83461 RepID=UPI001CBA99EA|nr:MULTISPECIES: exopolysaccharide biosynthesis response regulator EpsW [unclassified Corallococcus]MBZ4334797.1 response regulator [Corallococcus sp. AS-1-12]MBZ4375054.1 response regulator [Corallococcus sp. AS-1-6]